MPTEHRPAPKPLLTRDVPWQVWADVPRFGVRYRHLSLAALGEDYRVGVAIEELGPGRQSAPAHYHIFEEEHLYLLEGNLTLRLGADTFDMTAGDYACFPAGQKAWHCLLNTGAETCRYVIVGERNPNDVAVYTDTNKVLVRALGQRALFDLAATRGYWDGEDTGLPAGAALPEHVPAGAPAGPARPFAPISSKSVEWNDQGPPGSARFGGRSRHLTCAAVGASYRVGMLVESPAPGKRLAQRHYHMLEEEHALVLEGEVTLLLGSGEQEERFEMRPGDYVCFPAGLGVGHSFLNSGTGPCSYLMIGEHNPNDVCVYPDSNKMAVNALRAERRVFDLSAVCGYWDGEQ